MLKSKPKFTVTDSVCPARMPELCPLRASRRRGCTDTGVCGNMVLCDNSVGLRTGEKRAVAE